MGSSFIDFRDYGFWARDTGIEFWLYLLVGEIDRSESVPAWLREARDHWYEQATVGFGGWVHPQLDDYLVSQDRIDLVATLSGRALALLGEQQHVTGERLNALGVGGGGFRPDTTFEAEEFARVGRKFLELLAGELKTDASTSPVF